MAIVKVIEVLAESPKSWEEAVVNAVQEASKSVRNIKSVNVQNQSVSVKDDEVVSFRVNVKIAFEIER